MRFGLEDKYIDFIVSVLDKNIPCKSALYYIFGSRAKGTNQLYSDIDIAIDCNGKKISSEILSKIKFDFENSTLPYEVDIVDLNEIDEKFKNIIKNSLIKI